MSIVTTPYFVQDVSPEVLGCPAHADQLPLLSVGQRLSLPFVAVGLALIARALRRTLYTWDRANDGESGRDVAHLYHALAGLYVQPVDVRPRVDLSVGNPACGGQEVQERRRECP